jgi:hypothetical protein
MLWYAAGAIQFWALCAALSMIARRDGIDRAWHVFATMTVLFFSFALLVGGTTVVAQGMPGLGALYLLAALLPGAGLLHRWILRSIWVFVEESRHSALGIDRMKIRRSYDAAEGHMRERRLADAEREFLAGAQEEAGDPEPLRKAGEAALAGGRIREAVGHFRAALALITSEEDRASLAIRIAEIEERRLGDRAGARRTLEVVLPDFKPGKWGDYVRERLSRIE